MDSIILIQATCCISACVPQTTTLYWPATSAVIGFWYRQHKDEFLADSFYGPNYFESGTITYGSPANSEPGMIRLILDAKGRLYALEARPEPGARAQAPEASTDWSPLFAAAGLDLARFTPAPPQLIPPVAFDARMAWTGTFTEGRKEKVRLEAASWEGRPVYFNTSGDWQLSDSVQGGTLPVFFLFIFILIGAGMVAWNNFRLGRGDRRGAANLAAATFLIGVCAWVTGATHVANTWEIFLLVMALSWATFAAGVLWALYMAVEPYVRGNWPDALISWTRLQSGRIRDPLVASHVLVGIATIAGVNVLVATLRLAANRLGPVQLSAIPLNSLDSVDTFLSEMLTRTEFGLALAVGFLLVVALLRLLVGRLWIADVLGTIFSSFRALRVPGICTNGFFSGCRSHCCSPACYGCSAASAS